jgi:hypothetical protein
VRSGDSLGTVPSAPLARLPRKGERPGREALAAALWSAPPTLWEGAEMARTAVGTLGLGRILIAISVVIFIIAAFGVDIGADVGLVSLGLAFFAAGHVV